MLTPQGSHLASHEELQRLVQEHSQYSQTWNPSHKSGTLPTTKN